MSNLDKLTFFNKEGDCLNFKWNATEERFDGDIIFDENSSDTYKTQALYLLEKVPSFEFEDIGNLYTNKFQLFNEYGLHFYGTQYTQQQVLKIEPVNNDPNFYSKWIYGNDFEKKFKKGTLIYFNEPFLEFENPDKAYVVIGSKKNAILIISSKNNQQFENDYYTIYNTESYNNVIISGLNSIGVYNYIDQNYDNKLSSWSEPNFYDKLYSGKKINVLGSSFNDSTLTISNKEVLDNIHYCFELNKGDLSNDNLLVEIILKSDLPLVYSGYMNITDKKIFLDNTINNLSLSNEFKIVNSQLNSIFFTIKQAPEFIENTGMVTYGLYDQVKWNNLVYHCITPYTHDHSTSLITPDDTNYWILSNIITVNEQTNDENLLSGQIYLTTNIYHYQMDWDTNSKITISKFVDKYKETLSKFDLDTYIDGDYLKIDPLYASNYIEVNFFKNDYLNKIGITKTTNERLIPVTETITSEYNYNFSEINEINITFVNIDSFGLKIEINKMVYSEELVVVTYNNSFNLIRSIDATLRRWITRYYLELYKLGITTELYNNDVVYSPFYNSIKFTTDYPNVPIDINKILVGTTGDFYVDHTQIELIDIGPYLTIVINNREYGILKANDINTTISNWIETYLVVLNDLGLYPIQFGNILLFRVKDLSIQYDINIKINKFSKPGSDDFKIINKIKGNFGVLLASNEVKLKPDSELNFIDWGFANGMVFSINNTIRPFVNSEFNINYLDQNTLNLSYQGPFWDINNDSCNVSPFVTLAFNNGFNQGDCEAPPVMTEGGPFSEVMFDLNEFSISYNPTTYTQNSFNTTQNLVDIIYINLLKEVWVLGDDINIYDSTTKQLKETITLDTLNIKMVFNKFDNNLYVLNPNKIYKIDITTRIKTEILLLNDGFDIITNDTNGDIYVSYSDVNIISVFGNNSTISINLPSSKLLYHVSLNRIYTSVDDDIYIIDGSNRTIITNITLVNLTSLVEYNPLTESALFGTNSGLYSILDQTPVLINNSLTNDVTINIITNKMILSENDNLTFIDGNNSYNIGITGDVEVNLYDGDIYVASNSSNNIIVANNQGNVLNNIITYGNNGKMIYVPDSKSMWILQTDINKVMELKSNTNINIIYDNNETLNVNYQDNLIDSNENITINNSEVYWVYGNFIINGTLTNNGTIKIVNGNLIINNGLLNNFGVVQFVISNYNPNNINRPKENQYGTLSKDYVKRPDIWLKSREYYRQPKENLIGDQRVEYYYKWYSDNVPEFFLYDFSGNQVPEYTGEKPMKNIVLNKTPNKDQSKNSISQFQQTIFDKIRYPISYLNEDDSKTPLELFIGFKSLDEGATRSILQLYKKEDIKFTINSSIMNYLDFYEEIINGQRKAVIKLNEYAIDTFTNKGLKVGQIISINIKDNINVNKYISNNNSTIYKINSIYTKRLVLDFITPESDYMVTESTVITDYPKKGITTFLDTQISVIDKEVARFFVYGQTEEEDIRFKIQLGNEGKLINPDEVFIFKDYDIEEGGLDWSYMNQKRKEMLMVKNSIYNFIGAYKSIINAINYFGYNDLQLNEYYRDIDTNSPNFSKLFKVEIPDIFNNSIVGWEDKDFLIKTNSDKYEGTNLFNLTYDITNKDGDIILEYSIDEIIIKLQGLKYFLKKNIIPLTHKILDITGRAYINDTTYIKHNMKDIQIIKIQENMTPFTFKLNEAYLIPVNSGSLVYNCVLDIFSISNELNYNGLETNLPNSYDIKVRTYQTYNEWLPFNLYNNGDRISYDNKTYESTIDNNKLNNPKLWELSEKWVIKTYYFSNVVSYKRRYYTVKVEEFYSEITPDKDFENWEDITKWIEIDLETVQYLYEYRTGIDTRPYSFTIDTSIDPFITIELTSGNDYGVIYRDRKNYEIKAKRTT